MFAHNERAIYASYYAYYAFPTTSTKAPKNPFLFGILTTSFTGLPRLRLDEKVDQEEDGKESSQQNRQVSSKLNLEGYGLGWELFND